VVIAAPDHWHALLTGPALKAGAHLFVEKPTGHTGGESPAMVKAAPDAGRGVEGGLHRPHRPPPPSRPKFPEGRGPRPDRKGAEGMVGMCGEGGGEAERRGANREAAKGLNWDLYCGPAPLRPFNTRIHPGGWRNFLDFANGTLGDWGVHWLDQVLWWADDQTP